jgi:Fe-S-cluster containining protein
VKLPLAPDESPCFGCSTPCCVEYVVPISGHDLWRLTRALGVPWQELVTLRRTPDDWVESFRLHAGGERQAFLLRKKPSGGCALLLELPDGSQRCGAHAARPLACRVYPFHSAWRAPTGIDFVPHALCPTIQRARYELRKGAMADEVIDTLAERALHIRAVERWEIAAGERTADSAFTADEYVAWLFRVFEAVEALRAGRREQWQPRALALIAGFLLPVELAPGC